MKIPLPIRVYADFECFNQPQKDPKVLFKQILIAVGFYLISPFGNQYYSYFDEGCLAWFVNEMLIIENFASNYFETNLELQTTPREEEQFQQSTIRWLCEQLLTEGKVGDHDHLTGNYREATHSKCNINEKQKQKSFIPIFFHNSSGYDCHLIFDQLSTQAFKMGYDPEVIPKSMENVSVPVGCLRFLDSYRFLGGSLDKFVKSISSFPIMDSNNFKDEVLKKKLAYPYRYLYLSILVISKNQ